MSTVTTKDGVQIFYKDWDHGQAIVFHDGSLLSSDDWDGQMLFFVQHRGDDDQIVPYRGAALLQVKLLKNATLRLYPGFPHGMLTTNADTINQDLLQSIAG